MSKGEPDDLRLGVPLDRPARGVRFVRYPVTVYWIVAVKVVPGVVSAGTATTIWLLA